MWQAGLGRELWEQSEAVGASAYERHLCATPVSSFTEELRKDNKRIDDSARSEMTSPGFYVVVFLCSYAAVVCDGLPLYFRFVVCFMITFFWTFAGSCLLFPWAFNIATSYSMLQKKMQKLKKKKFNSINFLST